MLLIILLGLITSCLLIPLGRYLRSGRSIMLSLLPISLFGYFALYVPYISSGNILYESIPWVPSLGINLDFRLDGLSLMFSLLITGVGSLIFIYASNYLKGHPFLDRFYGYLCLFMSAMLGVVLSDNILLLFIFWELTSISSFFLIGFNNDSAVSRKSALTALGVTGLGGFFLLAGMIMVGEIGGTYSIKELIASGSLVKGHYLYPYVLGLVFMGAFTKSAQFPFHFWLPGAMKAPTPVSAYLHSATMVKAGIFLLARFTPILGDTPEWSYTLMIVGGITMVYAAIHSLLRTDLKGVLAYSTIAVLGVLTFLIGLGTKEALIAASTFIIAHALYKASLFLVTGIIDHQTGTRELTQLSGLRKVLFPVFIAGTLAALSSAGLPFSFGFIGKDLIYEATLAAGSQLALVLTFVAVLANICLVAAGFMAGIKPFMGSLPNQFEKVKMPSAILWMPPVILGVLGFVFGCMPGIVGENMISPTVNVLSVEPVELKLKIWHGFNTVLWLSLTTIIAGTIVYLFNKPSDSKVNFLDRFHIYTPHYLFGKSWSQLTRFSVWYTNFMHNGFLRSYLIKIIIFAEVLLIYELVRGGPIHINYSELLPISVHEGVNVLILLGALYLTVTTTSRLTAVVGTSIIGYAICLMFVFYSAPDLAITQFTIDTLTVVLFVFVLFNLPSFLVVPHSNRSIVVRDVMVAGVFGVVLSLTAIKVLQVPTHKEISEFYGEFAYSLAKGKNVVNIVLVDFRGFDTMFEIVVLSISALGVYSLIKLKLKTSEKE